MKVILLQDSKDLGKKGTVVNVSDGYARNYLLPRKIAALADESAMRDLAERKKREDAKMRKLLEQAKAAAARLEGKSVRVKAKDGDNGRLFGSVTTKDIADSISAQYKIAVDKRRIDLEDQVKTVGVYTATLKLHQDVQISMNVEVVAEEERT